MKTAELLHSCPRCKAIPEETCITTSGAPAREMHSERSRQVCRERFLVQRLADPEQDRRMTCCKLTGHRGRHGNIDEDLTWAKGFSLDLEKALA